MLDHLFEKTDSSRALYIVLIISVSLKVGLLLLNKPFNSDGVLYITAAQSFAEGNFAEGLAVYPMPLYSLLITGVHFLIPSWEIAAKVISISSMVLVTIPLYYLTAHLFNRQIAFWTCLALALAPVPNDWSVDVIRGPIFVLFAVLSMYWAHLAIDIKKQKYFAFTALTAGISFFFRLEGIIIIVYFGLYGIYYLCRSSQKKRFFVKGYSMWLVTLFIFALFASAGTFVYKGDLNRIEEIGKRADHIISLGFLDNYHILYDQLDALEDRSPSQDTNHSMAEVARHFMFLIFVIGEMQVFFKILFPLFIIPLFIGLKIYFNKRHIFLIGAIIFYLLIMYIFYIDRNFLHKRFLFTPVVLTFPWVGAGLYALFLRAKKSMRPSLNIAICIILFLLSPAVESVHSLAEEDNVLRKAGNWFQQQKWSQNATVISNESRAAFFSGIRFSDRIMIAEYIQDANKIEDYALQNNADIIILEVSKDEKYIKNLIYYERLKVFLGKKRDVYILGQLN